MDSAQEKLVRCKISHIDKVRNFFEKECVDKCNGQGFECANEILQLNHISATKFITDMRELLIQGKGKD